VSTALHAGLTGGPPLPSASGALDPSRGQGTEGTRDDFRKPLAAHAASAPHLLLAARPPACNYCLRLSYGQGAGHNYKMKRLERI
jgi:hypothetical protein